MHSLRAALVAALLVTAACSSGSTDGGPTAKLEDPSPTVPPSVEHEVEVAYLHSWDVYAKAARDLDPAGLDAVFADQALELARYDIDRLKKAHTPGRYEVEHHLVHTAVSGDTAEVKDSYQNHSVALDGTTLQPIEADPNVTVAQTYILKRSGSTWLVTDVARSSQSRSR